MAAPSTARAPKAHAIIFLADRGQDPTEVAIPWRAFKNAGFAVTFATETGSVAVADEKILDVKSLFGRVLGASRDAAETYGLMAKSPEFLHPRSWSADDFDILQYDVVLLPGGHDKPIRQYVESPSLHAHLARFFPLTSRSLAPSSGQKPKVIGAICHGVLALAFAPHPDRDPSPPATSSSSGSPDKTLLHELTTTTLPKWMEAGAWVTSQAWLLGGYYRTYEGRWCAGDVVKMGAKYVRGPMNQRPFVVVDEKWRYVSARWPGDAEVFAEKVVQEVQEALGLGKV